MNSFNTLLLQRRSSRNFLPKPVEKEKEEELITAALASPSSRNLRPWEFIIVRDKAKIAALSRTKPHGAAFLAEAPLAIVVAADPQKNDVWVEDCSIASINIQLAAESAGLGSCWIQLHLRKHESGSSASRKAAEIVGLPDQFEVLSIIALGYPREQHKPLTKEDLLKEKAHLGSYGSPYFSSPSFE
jgi:nitroreductase